jgi:hypothetical protein
MLPPLVTLTWVLRRPATPADLGREDGAEILEGGDGEPSAGEVADVGVDR